MLRFIAKNKLLAFVLFAPPVCFVWTFLLTLAGAWTVTVTVSAVLLALLIAVAVLTAQARLLNRAVKKLHDNCDPYPLLSETEEQLTYKNNKGYGYVLVIDKAAALREMGRLDEALVTLNAIENEMTCEADVVPMNAIVYFHNLAELYTEKKDFPSASSCYAIMMDKYSRVTSKSVKNNLAAVINSAMALECIRCKDYRHALAIIASEPHRNLKSSVCASFLSAECCTKLGDTAGAKYYLDYVIANGGKLCCVEQARRLLSEFN